MERLVSTFCRISFEFQNDIDWFRVYAGAFLARESFYKQLCFTNETSLPCALFLVFLVICCDVQGPYLRWPTTFTAKEITSRQKGKDSQQKEEPHGKREKTHRKRKHLTANEKPHGKKKKTHGKRKDLTVRLFLLPWGYSFCCEVFSFSVSRFLFSVRFFFCGESFSFCRGVFSSAVSLFFLLRGSSFCREVISLAVTVVGHRTYWFGKI